MGLVFSSQFAAYVIDAPLGAYLDWLGGIWPALVAELLWLQFTYRFPRLVYAREARVVLGIDLMGSLLEWLTDVLRQEPLGHPGLYRRLNQVYFERVAAIDFAMAHDDGQSPKGWSEAEIVLVGVSRVGKTPLSMYLAVMGWKVANVPLVPGLDPSPKLFELDPRRVVGLTMSSDQLVFHRQQRRRLGAPGLEAYTDLDAIREELATARRVFRRGGLTVIDVTDKPIEASANQVIELITRRFGDKVRA